MCEYCSDAFIDLSAEDNAEREDISTNVIQGVMGELEVAALITENGTLMVEFCSDYDVRIVLNKKIRFCPMCGAEIQHPTPTERYRMTKER